MTSADRFWAKVTRTADCWLWTGADNGHGYGHFTVDGRTVMAHRLAYEFLVGTIPAGLQIDHLCRVRKCVNPEHLEPVTAKENLLRAAALITECPQGHAYDHINTYLTPQGRRQCRRCHVARTSAARAAKRPARSPAVCRVCSIDFTVTAKRGPVPLRCPLCAAARRHSSKEPTP